MLELLDSLDQRLDLCRGMAFVYPFGPTSVNACVWRVADLDPSYALAVMDHLRRFAGQGGAVVVVLHDLSLAVRYCDRLVLLDAGSVVAAGAPDAVLTKDRLAEVYGISAVHGQYEGEAYVVPWKTGPAADGGAAP